MKYFAAVVVSCMALFTFCTAEPPCHMQEVSSCLDIAIAHINSLPRRHLPTTDQEVNKCCGEANSTLSCLKDYGNRCMTIIQRELSSLILEGVLDLYDQFCVSIPSKARTDYLAHSECLNKVMQGEALENHLNYLLAGIEHLLNLPSSQQIQYLCCGYSKIYHLIRSEVVSTCSEEAAQAVEKIIFLVVAQLPDVICTGIDGNSEECTAILPPAGAKPTDKIKEHPIYKSVFETFKHHLE